MPAAQAQAFRLIDALPILRDDVAVATAVQEFFAPALPSLPWLLKRGLGLVRRAPPALTAWAVRQGAEALAQRFLLGADHAGIARHLSELHARGLAFTVDWLGEAVLTEAEAEAYQRACLDLLPVLAVTTAAWPREPGVPHANLSLKLSALTSRFEPADPLGTSRRVRERLRPILRAAQACGALINIDMEHHQYRDATLCILADVACESEFRAWDGLGIAIQAYLGSAPADLARLHALARQRGAPLWVRLVKGAYWDHEVAVARARGWPEPVLLDKAATDLQYERLTRWMLERHAVLRPAFASHNVRSVAHALAACEALNLPARTCEFQLLHGMADPLKTALVARGERVRVYCPVGALLPGMAYLVRRLLENTSNQGFIRAGFLAGRPAPELLMRPTPQPITRPTEAAFVNLPTADFSVPAQRSAMQTALDHLSSEEAGNGAARVLVSTDPAERTRIVGRVPQDDALSARRAVDRAAAAAPGWAAMPWSERIACLRRAGDRIAGDRWRLAARLVREVGKTWREADAEVAELVDFCRYYADQAALLATARHVDAPGEHNEMLCDPRGVAVVIAPWNFPLAILGGMTVAALVTGNTVVMKPAEQAAIIGLDLHRHLLAAGIPGAALQLVQGLGEEVGPALVEHPATAVIAFTGSRAVGLGLNRSAATALAGRDHLVKVICELGGKNAIIVDASADLDEAVSGVMASAFGFQGQKCSACSRVIVHADVYAAFTERLVAAVRDLTYHSGPGDDPGHLLGPVIDDEAQQRLEAACVRFRALHHCAFAGDVSAWTPRGCWVAPHVFIDVDPASELAQEEQFGPLLAVIRATDLGHALTIANGTRYALTGGCFARSPAALERVRRDFRVGNLYLNRGITGALVHRQPFGGFKLSGGGTKAGGPEYLQQFVVERTVTVNTLRHGMVE